MNQQILRTDINDLKEFGLHFEQSWEVIDCFEKIVSRYFGSRYAVAVDSCTHGLELCLRLLATPSVTVKIPAFTYMSVPMTLDILGIDYQLTDQAWEESYYLHPYPIVDAATQWRPDSYVPDSYTVLSFQYQKHLAIGRGGMILLNNLDHYELLQKMTRDGRDRTMRHDNDNVKTLGYHYQMTPEDAARGIRLFYLLKDKEWQHWTWQNYTDLRQKDFFCDK